MKLDEQHRTEVENIRMWLQSDDITPDTMKLVDMVEYLVYVVNLTQRDYEDGGTQ